MYHATLRRRAAIRKQSDDNIMITVQILRAVQNHVY